MSIPRRVLAICVGLWFVLLVGEPMWLSPCPSHGAPGVRGDAAALVDPAAGDVADGEHAHAAAHATEDAPGHGGSDGDHRCSCPGPSCGVGAMTPAPAAVAPLAAIRVHHAALTVAALEHHPLAAEHSLPFANGPPRVARA